MFKLLALLLLFPPASVFAQTYPLPIVVDSRVLKLHALKTPLPDIPPIARAAHEFGEVKVHIAINPEGRVVAATIIDGPAMLMASALDNVINWKYQPFEQDGHAVTAIADVTVSYSQNSPSAKIGKPLTIRYQDAKKKCYDAAIKKMSTALRAKACMEEGRAASELDPDVYAFKMSESYTMAANEALHDNQFDEALSFANKTIALNEKFPPSFDLRYTGQILKIEAEWGKKDFAATDSDLADLEQDQRLIVAQVQEAGLTRVARSLLHNLLSLHAQVLAFAGKPAGSHAKAEEAAKLSSQ